MWKTTTWAVVLASSVSVMAAQDDKIQLVMVVGCLAKQQNEFVLEKGTAPESTKAAFTSTDEVAASAKKPLGTTTFRLLGTSEFGPDAHVGHRVQVKGLLIVSGQEHRVNVTSLQHIDPACP